MNLAVLLHKLDEIIVGREHRHGNCFRAAGLHNLIPIDGARERAMGIGGTLVTSSYRRLSGRRGRDRALMRDDGS
jgi:hypothetical protein